MHANESSEDDVDKPHTRAHRAEWRRRAVRISNTADYDRGADNASGVDGNDEGFTEEFWLEQRPPHSVY